MNNQEAFVIRLNSTIKGVVLDNEIKSKDIMENLKRGHFQEQAHYKTLGEYRKYNLWTITKTIILT